MLLWCRSLLCSPNRQVYPLFHQPHGQQPEYPQMYPLPDFWKLNVNLTLLSWSLCQFFHTPTSIYLPLNFVRQDFQRYWNLRVRQIKDCSSLLPFAGSCSGGPWVEADCGSWKRHWGWGGGYKKNTRMTSSIKSNVQAYTLFYKGRVQKKLEFSNGGGGGLKKKSNFFKNSAILLRMPWISEKCNKFFLAFMPPPLRFCCCPTLILTFM